MYLTSGRYLININIGSYLPFLSQKKCTDRLEFAGSSLEEQPVSHITLMHMNDRIS